MFIKVKGKFFFIFTFVLAVAVALGIGAILMLLAGANPLTAYWALVYGAFGNTHNFTETLVRATPLLIISQGLVIAFRCKMINIGAEGQLYMGALFATIFALNFTGSFIVFNLLLLLIIGFLGGAFWGSVAGILREKLGVNEIFGTIMLNWIAIFFVSYIVSGPMKDPVAWINTTKAFSTSFTFPILITATRFHAGFIVGLIFVPLTYLFLFKTIWGFRLRVTGSSRTVASYSGLNVRRNALTAMFLSGGLAGVAGTIEVSSVFHRLIEGFSAGWGYTAIVVAWLGNNHPIGAAIAAIFFGALLQGGDVMERTVQVPFFLVLAIQGLILFSVIASEYLRRR